MATWILSRKVFALRSLIFFTALLLTLISRDFAREIFFFPLIGLLMVYHLIWAFAMIEMFLALLPGLNHFIGRGKVYRHNYIPQCYNQNELKLQTRLFDRRAFSAALVWLTALISIGLFRLEHCWVIMISFLFYYLDQLFVNVWCPFQNWIIRNRCCATCRIYS